tara:strand:- start:1030 stop:2640 length:1611 start_codon:yes stop_codon:yes gene_type:complete
MIFEDVAIDTSNIKVHQHDLKSNPDVVICSGITTMPLQDLTGALRLDPQEKETAELIIDRIKFQRNPAWGRKDRNQLLRSIDKNLDINFVHIWFHGGPNGKSSVIDGGNRLETARAFLEDEKIILPNGLKERVTFRGDDESPSTFAQLAGTNGEYGNETQRRFTQYNIRVQVFFVMPKSELKYEFNEELHINEIKITGEIRLANSCPVDDNTPLMDECVNFIATQFVAYQKGKQNSAHENLRADRETNGVLSRAVDDISQNFGQELYGFKARRAGKEEYVSRIAYILKHGPSFGSSKNKQIEELYKSNKDPSDGTTKLIEDLKYTINNLKKTQELYAQNHVAAHITTGDCFSVSDGWLLTPFFFNYVFKNYSINTDEDYLAVGKIPSDLFGAVNQMLVKIREAGSITSIDKPAKNEVFETIVFKWCDLLKTKKFFGKGAATTSDKWKLLEQLLEFYASDLKPLHDRITFPSYVKTYLLEKADFTCVETNQRINKDNSEIHHIVQLKDGGTNDLDNLQILSIEGHAQIDKHRHLKAA